MDSDVLTKIHRNVSRIYVALESGSQQSDSLRLEHGYAINNVERVLSSEKNRENNYTVYCCLSFSLHFEFRRQNNGREMMHTRCWKGCYSIWGFQSFWSRCLQFCGIFTRHWDEQVNDIQSSAINCTPKLTTKAYAQGVRLSPLCLASRCLPRRTGNRPNSSLLINAQKAGTVEQKSNAYWPVKNLALQYETKYGSFYGPVPQRLEKYDGQTGASPKSSTCQECRRRRKAVSVPERMSAKA